MNVVYGGWGKLREKGYWALEIIFTYFGGITSRHRRNKKAPEAQFSVHTCFASISSANGALEDKPATFT